MKQTRVLIVAEHSSTGYSGGRLHIWMMGEALAAEGVGVTAWTNVEPFLARDFVDFPGHNAIDLYIDNDFRKPPTGPYDFVVLAPHLRPCWRVFLAAILAAKRHGALLIFLDYESPDWYNTESLSHRPIWRTASWWAASRHAHLILSSTQTSSNHARRYYQPLDPENAFQVCPPAINSIAADLAVAEKERNIVCITRLTRSSTHKGATELLGLFCQAARGYKVVFIGAAEERLKRQMYEAAEQHGMTVVFRQGLTDLDKFKEIKRARAMVFLSSFEGFGYPPAEALYCGTPCIAYPLPVIRENFGDDLCYVSYSDQSALTAVLKDVLEQGVVPFGACRRSAQLVSFGSYRARLASLVVNWTALAKHRNHLQRTRAEQLVFWLTARFISMLYGFVMRR